MKKIIFMGTPQFAVEVLDGIIQSQQYEVVAVVTQPDRPVGRKRILTPTAVKELALKHNIKVYQPEKIAKSPEAEELKALGADLIVTAAYGQFVPTDLLDAPNYGSINVHASLLPKYRGGAPIHYALWNGDDETGISIIYMTKKMDAGDILSQRAIKIEDSDDVGILFEKLAVVGRDLLLDTLPAVFDETVRPVSQDESLVVFSPTITKEQEQLDWTQSSQEIDNHVRAFRPFPSTYTIFEEERVKIWQGQVVNYNGEPAAEGTIMAVEDNQVIIQCGQNSYYGISEWQESGKKRMSIEEWLNGNNPKDIIGKAFTIK
ncbi:methionyl-tRNA formyltransferase [Aerococcaceae bacterium WGS1372]